MDSNTTIDGVDLASYEYKVGSQLDYGCDQGVLVQGSLSRTCGTDLQWTGGHPDCGGRSLESSHNFAGFVSSSVVHALYVFASSAVVRRLPDEVFSYWSL